MVKVLIDCLTKKDKEQVLNYLISHGFDYEVVVDEGRLAEELLKSLKGVGICG